MAELVVEEPDADVEKMRASLNGSPPPTKRNKSKTVAARVRALEPEIRAKRGAGWTWEQIAAAMYQDESKASAIRTAYNRLLRRSKVSGKGKASKHPSGRGPRDGKAGGAVAKVEARPSETPTAGRDHPVPAAANACTTNGGSQPTVRSAPPPFRQLNDPGFRPTLNA